MDEDKVYKDLEDKVRIERNRTASRRAIAFHGFLVFTAMGLLAWVLYLAGVQ